MDRIAIIGLGYVGLPLAVALARHRDVTGFDVKQSRIAELARGHDRTREVTPEELQAKRLTLTGDPAALPDHDVYIITVPTPVDHQNKPDLGAVIAASRAVGGAIGKGAIVVLESTVYPGVTEEIVGPEVARVSGLEAGVDFFLGYSPERMNPGDREHGLARITKVVAGDSPATVARLKDLYGLVNGGNVFVARSIKVAEAAKVIENAQRDINIAFMNEVTAIFNRMDVSIHDVLDASRTKWNFLPFAPGLVGGHCIGVDPYYLATLAQRLGHDPTVILAGRATNDAMAGWIAGEILKAVGRPNPRALVLGLTFKENVPDIRNSKIADLVAGLRAGGAEVAVHDPLADPVEARAEYGIELIAELRGPRDVVIGAVAHGEYRALTADRLAGLLAPDGVLADIKGLWRNLAMPAGIRRWSL